MGNVLIVEHDKVICNALFELLSHMGNSAASSYTMKHGLEKIASEEFDVILLNTGLPDGNGIDVLQAFRNNNADSEIIVITESGDSKSAEQAIRNGAWDYIETKTSVENIMLSVERALQYRQDRQLPLPQPGLNREKIVGEGSGMKACIKLLAKAVMNDANVLITGETGTGKELFARAIHFNSPRADKGHGQRRGYAPNPRADNNFAVVDCTVLPETLVESVLFGHAKGAFTGADRAQEGLIKQADHGTLFLDEIGELPLSTQKTFLRVLQERRFRPVGGKQEVGSNFRLIAATNRDLDQMVQEGTFRADLLFRLRALQIELPPLRERREDIQSLAIHHMERLCRVYSFEKKKFSPNLLDSFEHYFWPGNVRELVNTIDAMLAMADGDATLYTKHLPLHIRIKMICSTFSTKVIPDKSENKTNVSSTPDNLPRYKEYRSTSEQKYLQNLMSMTNRNISQACRISGISRSRLYELLAKHDLSE
jgi:two-component system NtrC family response regulator